MNLEQALDELSRWEREAKARERVIFDMQQKLLAIAAILNAEANETHDPVGALNAIRVVLGDPF